jgi:putative hydrolase of the HAD superfamily
LIRAVIFDFYGTLGESEWQEWWMESILAERGHRLDPAAVLKWSANAWDGREHHEHSASEEHYAAWERGRWRAMLGECGVPEDEVEAVVAALDVRRAEFSMRLYPETLEVLRELKARGLRLAVCSNWDWDLDRHLESTGVAALVDARISSAWVGVRKPHPLIFDAALQAVGAAADEAVFVGDNWVADVEGPLAAGIRPVHIWRHEEHPGDWIPEPPETPDGVSRITDLRALPDLVA